MTASEWDLEVKRWNCWHGVEMAVEITVYDVPENVRDRLAEKAAERSQSLEEYLLRELERIATAPSVERLMDEIRRRKEAGGASIPTSEILAARDADRR